MGSTGTIMVIYRDAQHMDVRDQPKGKEPIFTSILRMDRHAQQLLFQEMYVNVNVITWRDEQFGLFDYRSQHYEQSQFHSLTYRLEAPKLGKTIYYYIHQSKGKMPNNHPFKFQRRKEKQEDTLPTSFTEELDRSANYKLIGGLKLDCRESEGSSGKPIVEVITIPLKYIKIAGLTSRGPDCLPYWVVRSLKQWVIRERQVLKFGRLELQVVENHTNSSNFQKDGNDPADILDLDEKIEQYSLMTIQTRKCRVCYGEEDENEPRNILINPCNCKGSIEWIHIECLRRWLESRLTKISLETGGNIKITNKNCCQLCKMRFPSRVRRNQKIIPLISFLEDDCPFISFAPVNIVELSDVDKFYVSFGEESSVRIGRQDDCGVLLTDQTVSRRHGILQIQKKGPCVLRDQDSKYGTLAYQDDLPIRLGSRFRAFQINNSVFCLTCSGSGK